MKAFAVAFALLATPASALTVAIDPGHGGEDPGAIKGGILEADITLQVAEILASKLRAAGVEVILTRDAVTTLHLIDRLELSRNSGADLFISIHADSLLIGTADGLSFYTHAREASAPEAQSLARQDILADLLFGPLAGQPESDVATTLMEMAQSRTHDLSLRLARTLATQASLKGLTLYRRPLQAADFVVLRSPAVPSVLVELGFLDSAEDRTRLMDPEWRARFAEATRDAVLKWAKANGVE
jgi:N-acetylmuramoyl-L-alanine amidase